MSYKTKLHDQNQTTRIIEKYTIKIGLLLLLGLLTKILDNINDNKNKVLGVWEF